MKNKFTICATLVATLMSTAAFADVGTVKSVRLSSGGVAEYVRTLEVVDGKAVIEVPTDQMDDFLKTLVVSGSAKVKGLSTTGPDMVGETFKTLPLRPEDLDSADAVLRALRGAAVSANGTKGRIVGVEPASERRKARLVVLLDDGSLDVAEIGGAMAYRLDDPGDAEMVRKAAELLAGDRMSGSRKVTISLEANSAGSVDVSYVVAAPLWKPSYRLVVDGKGGARLQAWAVLENASGEDWKDVALSLTSGKPVTLRQKLYERAWTDRAEVPVGQPMPAAPAMFRGMLEAKAEGAAAMAAPVEEAAVEEGDVVANYDLPGGYDLKNGETTSVPILDRKVRAEFVSLFRDGAEHPDAALVVRNGTGGSLPPAVAAVYDEKGRYVGDARFGPLKPDEAFTAVFASDQKVEQEASVTTSSVFRAVTVKDGFLTATMERRVKKTYAAWGADSDRRFVVEDRKMPGFDLVAGEGVEPTPEGARATMVIPAGRRSTTAIEWKTVESQTQAVADLDDAVILQWLGEGPSPEVAEKLKQIVAARGSQKEAQRELQSVEQSIAETSAESTRISEMLKSVGDSPIRQRFLSDLEEQEKAIRSLRTKREETRAVLRKLEKSLGEAIARL